MGIDIAIIAPTTALDLSSKGDIYMCLAWLALQNADYKAYFKKKAEQGEFVILDNGENEKKQITGDTLIELAIEIGAKELVLPDTFRDTKDTMRKVIEFLRKYRKRLRQHKIRTMAVVQGDTIPNALQHYRTYSKMAEIDTIGLGFDNYYTLEHPDKTQGGMFTRLLLTETISKHVPSRRLKTVHLLGLYNPIELKYQAKHTWIRSNDSSAPVLCAAHNILIRRDKGIKKKPAKYLNFTGCLSKAEYALAERNIEIMHNFKEGL